MDVRIYFAKIRQLESSIESPYVVVVSLETPDGGKPGVRTQVPRHTAAKLVVEGRVRLATAEETKDFEEESRNAFEDAQREAAASHIQVSLVPEQTARVPKQGSKKS